MMMTTETSERLGIVAFAGAVPVAIAEQVVSRGGDVFVLGVKGMSSPEIERFPHVYVRPFEVGQAIHQLRKMRCRNLVFSGSILRPRLALFRVDLGTLRYLPTIAAAARGSGDDAVARQISTIGEQIGFKILSPAMVAPELVARSGVYGRHTPTAEESADIGHGMALLSKLGPFDVGQAVIVHRGRVLAVEAAEGTDAMIERLAGLRANGRFAIPPPSAVFVKAPKPQQNLRDDMPVVGPETLARARMAGLRGIACAAGGVLLLDVAHLARAADEAGMFLIGVPTKVDGEPHP